MDPQDADKIVNNVDPDQTMFAQNCLSEKLGTLRYLFHFHSSLQTV